MEYAADPLIKCQAAHAGIQAMKPIHFQPKPDPSARRRAAKEAYATHQGPGVAAVVRSAASIEQPVSDDCERRVQLDDYVARIRQTANDACQTSRPEVTFRTSIRDKNAPPATPSASADPSTPHFQPHPVNSPQIGFPADSRPEASEESKDDSNTRLQRTDNSHASEGSQINSKTIQHFNDALHKLRAPHLPTDRFPKEGFQTEQQRQQDAAYQRQMIDDIGVAIASTLTDLPDQQLKEKLPSVNISRPVDSPIDSSNGPPVEVAAWDVEDFRWPTLSNQMIATASDAMQHLFDHVLNVSNDDETRPSNRLAVTGAGRGEGTSTIAISIARWAVACGKSVLLVDADLNSPNLTTQVGLQHGLSWLTAVERNDTPAEVIIRSQRTNLCVMPMSPIEARSDYPRCLFDSLGPFLGKVESHFDWIVMDFGPGSQLLSELSRPELLIDSALLIGADNNANGLNSLQRRLQSLGLERFVLAQNSVRQQEAA